MSNSSYGPSFPSSGEPEYAAAPPPGKRPGKLTAAVVISYVASALALVGGVIVVAAAGSQEFIDAFADSAGGDVSTDELTAGLRVIFGAIAVLALIALVVTPFVAKGAGWARIVLTVLGAVGLVACIFALPAGIIWMIAIITTIVLMFLSDSSAFFKSRRRA